MNLHLLLAAVFLLAGGACVCLFSWLKRVVPGSERTNRDMFFLCIGALGVFVIWQVVLFAMPIMESGTVFWGFTSWDIYTLAVMILVSLGSLYSTWKEKRRPLKMVYGLFAVGIATCTICYSIFAHGDSALNNESHEYADAAITSIISNWDMNELQKRASPEFRSATKDAALASMFTLFRTKLGTMKEYKRSQGKVDASRNVQGNNAVTATYSARATFDAGPAEIRISCVKHGDQWQILGFRVNTNVHSDVSTTR
jgi:hypothetical protein